ncbi:MAG: NYN domain-containing protein [Acidimicrobiia bacterium]|nr:NYN domain-containing protein [Acidimicrobiia bacterium]
MVTDQFPDGKGTDPGSDVEIEHRHLRSALEFAVAMSAEMARMKPPIECPREVKRHANDDRLSNASLGRIRRAIVADDLFRTRVAAGAIPELVDSIGRLWLQRPDAWREHILHEVALQAEGRESDDARKALQKSEKRRAAAEEATRRAVGEVIGLRSVAEEERVAADVSAERVAHLERDLATLRDELQTARQATRHAQDREHAAQAKLAAAGERAAASKNEPMVDTSASALDRQRIERGLATLEELRQSVAAAVRAADGLAADLRQASTRAVDQVADQVVDQGTDGSGSAERRESRVPLGLPGGVGAASVEAASFLLRAGATVLVDGYNVTKLAWPQRDLCLQRDSLIDALENLGRRFGASITIVFDGATVVGSHAASRRLVRVVYSPEGVTADDVIRDEVGRVAPSAPVIVVTNDSEIVRDVKAAGANVISSTTLADLL